MNDRKDDKETRKRIRIGPVLWGAFLGLILGTACSSALAPLIKTDWLNHLLIEGLTVGIPEFESSLGFFQLSFGFSLRLTLLSGMFAVTLALLLMFIRFKD